jgi:solute carrier family 13 (sodium-dependent dicarboxylate transporter), member 2/3/5
MKRQIGLIAGPVLFLLTLFFYEAEGLDAPAKAVLASTIWIAIWWISEVVPLSVTALLPIILFPLTGAVSIQSTTAPYGDKMIFLFLGGFIIAIAMEKWNLHRRIALKIILTVGTNPQKIILGFMIATAFLSMWISNTATTLMMMPIAFAVTSQFSDFMKDKFNTTESFFAKALLLGVAYAASIGGMATLVGTPTNAILAGVVYNMYQIEIAFYDWFIFAVPFVIVLLLICWAYIVTIAFPIRKMPVLNLGEEIQKDYDQLGTMRSEEVTVLIVFSITALAWISRTFFLEKIVSGIDDTIIAIGGAVVLFILPSKSTKGARILDWGSAAKLPWGILLLFGGGLSLASGFSSTGLATWIGTQLDMLDGFSLLVTLLIVVAVVNILTEITSNVATSTMILPILASLALALGVHPLGLMVSAAMASSCAFMLPVATPPNAIVFGTGKIRIWDMVRVGFIMNMISIILLTLFIYYVLPVVWKIELFNHPVM